MARLSTAVQLFGHGQRQRHSFQLDQLHVLSGWGVKDDSFFFSPQEITTSIKLEHFPPQKFSSGNGSNSRPNKKNISNDFVFAEMSFLFFFPSFNLFWLIFISGLCELGPDRPIGLCLTRDAIGCWGRGSQTGEPTDPLWTWDSKEKRTRDPSLLDT